MATAAAAAAPAAAAPTHAPAHAAFYRGPLRLLVRDDVAVIQPAHGGAQAAAATGDGLVPAPVVDTLCIDLPSGRVSRGPLPALAPGAAAADVPALVGLLRLRGGAALAVVTGAERVATLDGEPVYRITSAAVITAGMRVVGGKGAGAGAAAAAAQQGAPPPPPPRLLSASIAVSRVPRASPALAHDAGDRRLLAYLRDALDAGGAGRGLYFSPGGLHLTLHAQARADLLLLARAPAPVPVSSSTPPPSPLSASRAGAAGPLFPARCADRRFFWNRALAQPLLDAGADPFVPTVVMGSVRTIEGAEVAAVGAPAADGGGDGAGGGTEAAPTAVSVDVVLFARRAVDRLGTRHWRRGADPEGSGSVANFVETEQVVTARWGGGQRGRGAAAGVGGGAQPPPSSSTPDDAPPSVSSLVASFVQVRGSVPVVWTQLPNIKYKPPTVVLDGAGTRRAFDAHARALHGAYVVAAAAGGSNGNAANAANAAPCVTLVDLVNQSGSEGALAALFAAEAARHNGDAAEAAAKEAAGLGGGGAASPIACPPLRYVPFDFHHECGKASYGLGLAALWRLLEGDFERGGMWTTRRRGQGGCGGGGSGGADSSSSPSNSGGGTRQVGVIRANCIDCLDRTNVVQGLLGRKALARALALAGALPPPDGAAGAAAADPGAGPELPASLESRFKHMWADHGDDVSRQYAGTGALKSGFTRTGRRTYAGLLDDGAKSAVRYLKNNFSDGRKQDALDLATGAFVPRPGAAVRFRARPSPLLPVGLALGAMAWGGAAIGRALGAASRALLGGGGNGGRQAALAPLALLAEVGVPLALAAALLLLVVRNGRHLVDAPQLCPEQANSVGTAVGKNAGSALKLGGGKGGKKGKAEMGSSHPHAKAE